MQFEYKVLPFLGQVKGKQSGSEAAGQLQMLINEQARSGWEFIQVADVNIEVQPGCLAGLFGAQISYMRLDQVIFRQPKGGSDVVTGQSSAVRAVQTAPTAGSAPAAPVGPTGKCPNCGSVVALAATECPKCNADFGPLSAWKVERL